MLKDCPDKPTPEILAALRTGSGKDYRKETNE